MDISTSLAVFSALSNAPRLDAFRLLVKAGRQGLTSGEIATGLSAKQNTTSTHLAILSAAGLVAATREGRSIRYRARMDTMREMIGFLMEDCCGGAPEDCRPVLDAVVCHD